MTRSPVALLVLLSGCDGVRATVVDAMPPSYEADDAEVVGAVEALSPTFSEADRTRPQVSIRLVPVVSGLTEPTDLQFLPGPAPQLVVLEKAGTARVFELSTGTERAPLFSLSVETRSEQGLLGLALHPRFVDNGLAYANHVVSSPVTGGDATRVSVLRVDLETGQAGPPETVIEVPQPYANHNAGQLAFGPDGYLYVGLGDGGWRDDPKGHGQNRTTLLGSMLRLDVDRRTQGRGYAVPSDNPFLGDPTVPPEVWALGLRNPWRYSFTPKGLLVVADVGQNTWEEVNLLEAGANLGWNAREGQSCFPPDRSCSPPGETGLQDPIYVYSHDEGQSITGGFVYTGTSVPALQGRYIFGDFVSGRLWAISLPEPPLAPQPQLVSATALGRFPILLSTFGQGPDGELYVADYGGGVVYRLEPGDKAGG